LKVEIQLMKSTIKTLQKNNQEENKENMGKLELNESRVEKRD